MIHEFGVRAGPDLAAADGRAPFDEPGSLLRPLSAQGHDRRGLGRRPRRLRPGAQVTISAATHLRAATTTSSRAPRSRGHHSRPAAWPSARRGRRARRTTRRWRVHPPSAFRRGTARAAAAPVGLAPYYHRHRGDPRGCRLMRSISRANVGVAAVACCSGIVGQPMRCSGARSRTRPRAATIVLGEHVVLVVLLLPVVAAALPALWRAGPRFVAAAVVVGAGSSALRRSCHGGFRARRSGDAGRPAEGSAADRRVAGRSPPRRASAPRFGLFLLGGLAGRTWLMAFPRPFDVSVHGRAPALYALAGGRSLGARHGSRALPLSQAALPADQPPSASRSGFRRPSRR